jgi:hypothetical protein
MACRTPPTSLLQGLPCTVMFRARQSNDTHLGARSVSAFHGVVTLVVTGVGESRRHLLLGTALVVGGWAQARLQRLHDDHT